MTTFALIHGATDGAWIWERLIPEIETCGHVAVAMDLPCDVIGATFGDDVAAVIDAIPADAGDDVVVAGHSLGGLLLSSVALAREVRHLVYVCALVPTPGKCFFEMMAEEPDMFGAGAMEGSRFDDQGRMVFDEEVYATSYRLDCSCSPDEARAYAKRQRPQRMNSGAEIFPDFPDTPSTYIVCTEDQSVNPDWSRRVAKERIDAEVFEMPGGHWPMLRDPKALADILIAVAR